LKSLTIADANDLASSGGGIYNGQGTLTVVDSTLLNNFGFNAGGAILNDGAFDGHQQHFRWQLGNRLRRRRPSITIPAQQQSPIIPFLLTLLLPFLGNPVSGGRQSLWVAGRSLSAQYFG